MPKPHDIVERRLVPGRPFVLHAVFRVVAPQRGSGDGGDGGDGGGEKEDDGEGGEGGNGGEGRVATFAQFRHTYVNAVNVVDRSGGEADEAATMEISLEGLTTWGELQVRLAM